MKIALLSPIAWRTPPRHYGPWENVVSLLAEGLYQRGMDVTLVTSAHSDEEAYHLLLSFGMPFVKREEQE